MNVLVDTSVWVDHFRSRNASLVDLIQTDRLLSHPMVQVEIACGTPPSRARTLADIGALRPAHQPTLAEVLTFIEHERLYGLGCGLVDITLLASTLLTPDARLWTLDRRLSDLSVRFKVAFLPHP